MSKINEKINENEEEKVSGGTGVIFESSSDNSFKGTNGKNLAFFVITAVALLKEKVEL